MFVDDRFYPRWYCESLSIFSSLAFKSRSRKQVEFWIHNIYIYCVMKERKEEISKRRYPKKVLVRFWLNDSTRIVTSWRKRPETSLKGKTGIICYNLVAVVDEVVGCLETIRWHVSPRCPSVSGCPRLWYLLGCLSIGEINYSHQTIHEI